MIPQVDDFGLPTARIIMPTAPEMSILSLRMHATGARRMPPLASRVVDVAGVEVIDAWIRGLNACSASP